MNRWPFPGDLPVDRARLVALQYRELAWRMDPAACAAVDKAAVWAGEHWVVSEWAIETEDDLVTVDRAAELTGRSTRTVYDWVAEHGLAVRRNPTLVRLGDVREVAAQARARRSQRGGSAAEPDGLSCLERGGAEA